LAAATAPPMNAAMMPDTAHHTKAAHPAPAGADWAVASIASRRFEGAEGNRFWRERHAPNQS
jgi:hypothetical protein